MKIRMVGLILTGLIFLIGAATALANSFIYLNYPYFAIPLATGIDCSSTYQSHPSDCVVPASSTYYFASATGGPLTDSDRWAYAYNYSSWNDDDKLLSMCIAQYESGGYIYNQGDNSYYDSGKTTTNDRFDYGYLQVDSLHLYSPYYWDAYYLDTSPSYNVSKAYTTWLDAGDSWSPWTAYTNGDCDSNGAVFQWVSSPTCSYDLNFGWGVWNNDNVWVWYLGYPGNDSNYIAGMFC